jgi:hypothetical protein
MTVQSSTVLETGIRLSVPVYVTISAPEAKLLLNAFRTYINADPTPVASRSGNISTVTAIKTSRQLKAEQALGMSLEVLRQQLLSSRSSLNLEQALTLQELTGVTLFNRKDVEKAYKGYLDAVVANVTAKSQEINGDAQE